MTDNQSELQELAQLLRALGAADLSILHATLETADSQIATVRNSPNDRLWSKLTTLGLAREMSLDIEIPPQLKNFQPRSFSLTEAGRQLLPRLLQEGRL